MMEQKSMIVVRKYLDKLRPVKYPCHFSWVPIKSKWKICQESWQK